ncbi:MAG: hypothetical protein ACFFAS_20460 [Promethearchaeota archaeon]
MSKYFINAPLRSECDNRSYDLSRDKSRFLYFGVQPLLYYNSFFNLSKSLWILNITSHIRDLSQIKKYESSSGDRYQRGMHILPTAITMRSLEQIQEELKALEIETRESAKKIARNCENIKKTLGGI